MKQFHLFMISVFIFLKKVSATNNSTFANETSSIITTSPTSSTQSLTSTMTSSLSPSMTSSSTSSMASINQSININATSTTTGAQSSSSATVQAEGSSNDLDFADIPLPPETERRDYDFVANTKMKWVPYLLDRNGAEFIFMAKLIEKTFNGLFKNTPGFIKSKLSEFQQEKMTFILIIYTSKEDNANKADLEKLINTYLATDKDVFKIYQYEVNPRFQEMPPDTRAKPQYTGVVSSPEEINVFLDFMRGFGIAIGMVAVFTIVAILKYKISQSCKSKNEDDKELLKEKIDDVVM